MKLSLTHTMLFVGSIWNNKCVWFLFVMSLWLLVAKEIVLTAGIHHWFFDPSFAENQPCMTPKIQWNTSLSIQCCLLGQYKRTKVVDSCLLCPCGWLVAARKLCWQLGSITDFLTQVLLKTNPAWHQRANETIPCPWDAVCWIHMEQ
jgi:hypothetical protein